MDDLNAYADYFLKKLKAPGPESEAGYHGLIEADHAIIPLLIAAFRAESDTAIRDILVEIIWQHRLPETVNFLAEALEDPVVWKSALDGLVSIGTPEAIHVLESAKRRIGNTESEKIRWIDEAILQIKEGPFTSGARA